MVNSFQFAPAEREFEFDVDRRLCIVRQLVVIMVLQFVFPEAEAFFIIFHACRAPVFEPFHGFLVAAEEFHFHLRELAGAECEVAGRDLVAERLADLRNTERKLFSRGDADQVEVHENRLACFGAEISDMFFVEDGADVCFHHQVEFARRRQISGTAVGAAGRVGHLIDTEPCLAVFAVGHDVAEAVDMSGCFPDFRVADDGGVKPDDILTCLDHFIPPELFDGFFHGNAIRAVIPESIVSAVDFRALKHKTAPFAQCDDLVHQIAFRIDDSHDFSSLIMLNFNKIH